MFGDFVRYKRLSRNLTLREFCRRAGEDPSNWSKIERAILPPPQGRGKLDQVAHVLGIRKGGREYRQLLDEAAVSGGKIPKDLMANKAVVGLLPAFLRTIGSEKPTRREIMNLLQKLEEER